MAFILVASDRAGRIGVYTGKAGSEWVSNQADRAFEYSTFAEANRKARQFNHNSPLHKIRFSVEERNDPGFVDLDRMYEDQCSDICGR